MDAPIIKRVRKPNKPKYGFSHREHELSAEQVLAATKLGKQLADTILLMVDDRIEESLILRALLSPGWEVESDKARKLVIQTMKSEVKQITF